MKPAKFDYGTVDAVNDVSAELAAGAGATKLIAGAQSLGPMLNLRLVRPAKLIDVSLLPELRETHGTAAGIELGAAVTHAEIEDGEIDDPTGGWLRDAASNIAHRAVRNRGTLGGSLAHADPAADWVIVMTGLDATIIVDGAAGRREISAGEFFTGPFETALRSGDIILSVRVARPSAGSRWGYWKFVRQVGEFAKASATVLLDPGRAGPRVAVGALGREPLVLDDASAHELVAGRATAKEVLSAALPSRPIESIALHVAALNNALAQATVSHVDSGEQ